MQKIKSQLFRANEASSSALKATSGFTLIEVLVSLAIFTIVVLMSTSALLSLLDVDKKAQSMKSVMNNLNFALESMAREIRVGTNYTVSVDGQSFTFTDHLGRAVTYSLSGTRMMRSISTINGGAAAPLTSPQISVDNAILNPPIRVFVLKGQLPSDTLQPYVLLRLKGHAGVSERTQTNFSIQTIVSQRLPDTP